MENITVWELFLQLFKAIMSVISANYLFTAFANKHKPNKYIALLCIVMFFLASTFVEIKPIRLLLLVICIFLFTFQFDYIFVHCIKYGCWIGNCIYYYGGFFYKRKCGSKRSIWLFRFNVVKVCGNIIVFLN